MKQTWPHPIVWALLSLFVVACVAGPFITGMPRLTEANWRWIYGLRIVLVLGSGIAFAALLVRESPMSTNMRHFWFGLIAVIALALTALPLMDFVGGATEIDGTLLQADERVGTLPRPNSMHTQMETFHSTIMIENKDGTQVKLKTDGMQASRLTDALEGCPVGSHVKGKVLRHMDALLHLECDPSEDA